MERSQFLLETAGHCFLCLRKPTEEEAYDNDVDCDAHQEENEQEAGSRVLSFRNICQYLKTDLKEVFSESVSSSFSSLEELEQSELKGTLCGGCARNLEHFSKDFLQLEMIQMKVKYSLQSIYDKIVTVNGRKDQDDKKILENFKKEMLRRPYTAFQYGIVERLRRQTLERCGRKLMRVANPQVKISRLTPEEIEKFQPARQSGSQTAWSMDSAFEADGIKTETVDLAPFDETGSESGDDLDPSNHVGGDREPEEDPTDDEETPEDAEILKTSFVKIHPSHSVGNCGKLDETNIKINPKTRRYHCTHCKKDWKNRRNLIRHYQRASTTNSLRYKCRLCGKELGLKSIAIRHHKTVHDKLCFRCSLCGKQFSRNYSLQHHQLLCEERRKPKPTDDPHQQEVEVNQQHQEQPPDDEHPVIVKSEEIAKVEETNPLSDLDGDDLYAPSSASGESDTDDNDDDEEPMEQAKKVGPNSNSFIKIYPASNDALHLLDEARTPRSSINPETGKLKCSLCPKEFSRPKRNMHTFMAHYESVHLNVKYKCASCGNLFSRYQTFAEHFKSAHLKEKYKCELCDKVFLHRPSLAKHHQGDHLMIRVNCQDCGKGFKQQSHLKSHQRYCGKPKPRPRRPARSAPKQDYCPPPALKSNPEDEGLPDTSGIQLETVVGGAGGDTDNYAPESSETFILPGEKPEGGEAAAGKKLPYIKVPADPAPTLGIREKSRSTRNPQTGNIKCDLCQQEFGSSTVFQRHYRSLHLQQKYKCGLCSNKVFSSYLGFYRHYKGDHMGTSFKCDICSRQFKRVEYLKYHQRMTSCRMTKEKCFLYKCFVCKNEFYHRTACYRHRQRRHHQEVVGASRFRFKCLLCPDSFKVEASLWKHRISEHFARKQHKCGFCSKLFSQRKLWSRHLRFHCPAKKRSQQPEAQRKAAEPIIPPPASSSTIIVDRNRSNSNYSLDPETGKYKCNLCEKEYTNPSGFRAHYRKHHLKILHKCPSCSQTFRTREGCQIHHQSVHMGVRYQCTVCGTMFGQKSNLNRHLKRTPCGEVDVQPSAASSSSNPVVRATQPRSTFNPTTGKHKCILCRKELATPEYVQEHYRAFHLHLRREYKCSSCGKEFARANSLRQHRLRVHLGVPAKKLRSNNEKKDAPPPRRQRSAKPPLRYICEYANCTKEFGRAGQLQRHVNSVHLKIEEEKPHGCSQCGKKFAEAQTLRNHLNTVHSSERKHVCHVCRSGFKEKGHLKKHLGTMHPELKT